MNNRRLFFVFIQILDVSLVSFAFLHLLSHSLVILGREVEMNEHIWILPIILFIVHVIFFSFGLYDFEKRKFFARPWWYVIPAAALSGFLSGSTMYIFKNPISRVFFVALFSYIALLISLERFFLAWVYQRQQESKSKDFRRNILIIGTNLLAGRLVQIMEGNADFDAHIIGFIDMDKALPSKQFEGKPILGSLEQLEEILRKTTIDEAVFCVKQGWECGLDKYFLICEEVGITIRVVADFFNLMMAKSSLDDYYGVPLMTFQTTPDRTVELLIKRCIDIFVSFFGVIILSPMFVLIAIIIKITMPGPVLFVQERSGLNKRKFNFYKFRTMVVDAEQLKTQLVQKNEMDGPVFKMKNDPRVTRFGRFLRKYSIDEFPQFWNVLIGDMSLVGPRPPIPAEVEKYDRWQLRRLSMRPGLTCIWQVSGRNDVGFLDWMKMDLFYIDNWSLWQDFKILLQTIPAVLMGRGAS